MFEKKDKLGLIKDIIMYGIWFLMGVVLVLLGNKFVALVWLYLGLFLLTIQSVFFRKIIIPLERGLYFLKGMIYQIDMSNGRMKKSLIKKRKRV